MIGNAYPFRDTGFSILEEGDLNPATLSLDVKRYLVMDRQAKQVEQFSTRAQAELFLENYFAQRTRLDQQ